MTNPYSGGQLDGILFVTFVPVSLLLIAPIAGGVIGVVDSMVKVTSTPAAGPITKPSSLLEPSDLCTPQRPAGWDHLRFYTGFTIVAALFTIGCIIQKSIEPHFDTHALIIVDVYAASLIAEFSCIAKGVKVLDQSWTTKRHDGSTVEETAERLLTSPFVISVPDTKPLVPKSGFSEVDKF